MVGKIQREASTVYKQIVALFPMNNEWTTDTPTTQDSAGATLSNSTPCDSELCDSELYDSAPCDSAPSLTKARRYWIDPKDMLQVQKQAREQGLSILGIYHSHPDHVAEPSECDRALAWPEYAYTIVSVCKGKAVDMQNWALDSAHQFQAEKIQISPPETSPCAAKDRMPISA